METPSPVKRKATIDLTRSDSDDEAPKRQRRVIEIGSDDDDDEAPRPTTTMPWETPEWRAHCEKHPSRRLAGVLTSLLGTNQEQSDEELWREIHDPVGAKRMELTRMLAGERFARLRSTDYIEREVAEFARKLDGPCECLREGPRKCVSRRARHDCSCRLGDPGDCKATSHHACCCRHVESSYKRKDCKATTHECICPHVDASYERKDCKAQSHSCICHKLESYNMGDCNASTHRCVCAALGQFSRDKCRSASHECSCHVGRRDCRSVSHKCVCRDLETYNIGECRSTSKHLCVCRKFGRFYFDRCKANKHLCTCSATTNAPSAGPSSTSEGRARATRNFNSSPNFLE